MVDCFFLPIRYQACVIRHFYLSSSIFCFSFLIFSSEKNSHHHGRPCLCKASATMFLHNFLLSIDLKSSITFILVHRHRLSINSYRGRPTGLPPGTLPVKTRCSIFLFRYTWPINVIIVCIICPGLYPDFLYTSSLVTCSFQLIFSIRRMNHVSTLINRFSILGHIVHVSPIQTGHIVHVSPIQTGHIVHVSPILSMSHPYSRRDHTYARNILSLVFSNS